jgi:hypothetical protein
VSIALIIITGTITDIDHSLSHAYVLWLDLPWLGNVEHISLS